ncbi:MAG: repair protein RecN [Frankiales bacterium]|nr:repair protein RecN [Frankiales bacterium]
MIEELRLRGLGVIDEAVLELAPGLTAVTGETGAGKTMVVTALGLLLGQRADSGLVRAGGAAAVVEGRWLVGPDDPAVARATDAGGELDEDGSLLITRTVSREGRSRAHLGGRQVPVGVLADLADDLVQIHGQGDQQRLLRPAVQRDALDAAGGPELQDLRSEYAERYQRFRALAAELHDIRTRRGERAQEAERLRFLLDEHDRLAPLDDEDDTLRVELQRLGHADLLRSAASTAHAAILGEEQLPDAADAIGLVSGARRALESVRQHDPELAALADRLADIGYALADTGADLAGYAAGVAADPERLQSAQERLAQITAAARARGVEGASALNRWAQAAVARFAELDGDDTRESAVAAEVDALQAQLAALGGELSSRRQAAGGTLGARITGELAALAMPHAVVTVAVTQREDPAGLPVGDRCLAYGPTGVDDVELQLVPHPGAPVRPLHKGASGGELSRVMLAVEVVLSGADAEAGGTVPTFVFDEVDAGVGGKAAVEVGRRLARLARHAQVLVVTHLPQVAAFADRHLVVEKSTDGSVTRSDVRTLDDAARVSELSRMLAGIEGSELALGHAEELLATAADSKAGA